MIDTTADAPLKTDMDLVGRRENRRAPARTDAGHGDLTDDDRLAMFTQQRFNNVLPPLPEIPGYHTCWLSSAHSGDSIQNRMQLGYEPVRPEELPGFEYASISTGEHAGMIGIREMLLFKLPQHLYQAYMRINHHDRPNEEEGKLQDTADMIRGQGEQDSVAVYEGDGLRELRANRKGVTVFDD